MYNTPLFSVIIPIYNREDFLQDAIESVLNQSCGLKQLELILVDDGSTDKSGEICDNYQKKYPRTVRVIHQENQGASYARNNGVKLSVGKWLNFLDSDDRWERNAFQKVKQFIKKHDDEVDVIAMPVYFFGSRGGEHLLNYKFDSGTRVVDLEEEWQNPQLFINSAFIRAEAAKTVGFFDPVDIPTNEDAREMQRVLLEKRKIGFLASTKYWYRRHEDTLVSNSKSNPKWYKDSLQKFSIYILDYAEEKCGYIPKFIQNTIMYELQWRLRQKNIADNILSEQDLREYKKLLLGICDRIDPDVIMAQKQLWREQKSYLLYRKEQHYPRVAASEDGEKRLFFFDKAGTGNDIEFTPLRLSFATYEKDRLILEGWLPHFIYETPSVAQLFVVINDKKRLVPLDKVATNPQFLGEKLYDRYRFSIHLDLKAKRIFRIHFLLGVEEERIPIRKIHLEQFFPLDPRSGKSYKKFPGWIMKKVGFEIVMKRHGFFLIDEFRYLVDIIFNGPKKSRKTIVVRLLYGLLSILPHKEIWMISDRILKADDNGEAFFKYLCDKKPNGIKPYFVISKDSVDYKRMQKIGPVVDYFSIKHRLLHLLSTYTISSQGEKIVQHPFRGYERGYRSLNLPKFVFLQHGVIKDDLSDWLNRYNKNLFGFVTTTMREYQSILEYDYFYSEKEVWLTGLPRYDYLEDQKEKLISIVPTWRSYLLEGLNRNTGLHPLRKGFENSEYFQFYNSLINHPVLLRKVKEKGYRLRFVPHPQMLPFIDLFHRQDGVEFEEETDSYHEMFAKSSLLVTDYSSTAFDFAYLNKPVIYCQFDKEMFFGGNHTYKKGYFDYETDGFGEVEYNLEDTINLIIEYIENDCKLKEQYQKRIKDTFLYHDKNNCERVYQKLIEMRKTIY